MKPCVRRSAADALCVALPWARASARRVFQDQASDVPIPGVEWATRVMSVKAGKHKMR